jgi:hypothetical protein
MISGDCRLYVPVAKQFTNIPLGEKAPAPKAVPRKCRFCDQLTNGNRKSTICGSPNCFRLRRNASQKAYYYSAGLNEKRRIARG